MKRVVRLRASGPLEVLSDWVTECQNDGLRLTRIVVVNDSFMLSLDVADCKRLFMNWKRVRRRSRANGIKGLRLQKVMDDDWFSRMYRLVRNPFLIAIITMCLVIQYYCFHIVWDVRIQGGTVERKVYVNEALRSIGLEKWAWMDGLPDTEMISRQVMQRVPGLTWVGVRREGTAYSIELQEQVVPQKSNDTSTGLNPTNLIATTEATVSRFEVNAGKEIVMRHQRVKTGDVLVSGVLGEPPDQVLLHAAGQVFGTVWYELRLRVPYRQTYQVMTGERNDELYFSIPKIQFRMPLFYGKQKPFPTQMLRTIHTPWQFGPWSLPFGISIDQQWETKSVMEQLTPSQSTQRALELARQNVRQRAGPSSKMITEKILQVQNDHDKVNLTVLYEMEEVISREEPVTINEKCPSDSVGITKCK